MLPTVRIESHAVGALVERRVRPHRSAPMVECPTRGRRTKIDHDGTERTESGRERQHRQKANESKRWWMVRPGNEHHQPGETKGDRNGHCTTIRRHKHGCRQGEARRESQAGTDGVVLRLNEGLATLAVARA